MCVCVCECVCVCVCVCVRYSGHDFWDDFLCFRSKTGILKE